MTTPNTDSTLQLAKQLHEWYIEATGQLDPKNYNPEARVPYEKLRPQQQDIDLYIAGQVEALITLKVQEARIDELKLADYRFTNPYLGKDKFQGYVQERLVALQKVKEDIV